MDEFYIELQDSNGTGYGVVDKWTGEELYFENLEDASLEAKARVESDYPLARVINVRTGKVVDWFQRHTTT